MKRTIGIVCLLVVSQFVSVSLAAVESHDEKEKVGGTETVVTSAGGTEIGLAFDLRPSWSSERGAMRLENEIALEVALSSQFHLGYTQEFQANLFEPSGEASGINPQANDGYLKGEWKDAWKLGRTGFSYETRVYLPTHAPERDAGLITALRNYAKISYEASDNLEFTLWEVPILHVYNRPGTEGAEGPEANPLFENRIYLSTNLSFFDKKLNLKIPIILQTIRHASFSEGSKHNDSWSHVLWVYPELTYALSEKTSIGLGYYSENLIADDFSASDFAGGFQKGITQIIFQQSL